jgi:hypothetical protein
MNRNLPKTENNTRRQITENGVERTLVDGAEGLIGTYSGHA